MRPVATPGSPCGRWGTCSAGPPVTARARARCPTSGRCSAWRSAGATLRNGAVPGLHPTRSARIVGPDEQALGAVGEIDPVVLEAHGIDERVGWLEVDLDVVATLERDPHLYRPVSIYPSSDIDLAFEVDDDVPADAVEQALRAAAGDRLASLRLFDVYRGTGIAEGRRSLAYTLRLDAPDHTLTDDEVADVRRRCIDAVESTLPATLRG